jgi:ubiquinone/menaquinone biosynthesis C-methylase UbiE
MLNPKLVSLLRLPWATGYALVHTSHKRRANMAYNPKAIRKIYDEIAEKEDEFEKGYSLRNEIPREFIKRYLGASDIVLDAGGGSGINAIMMAQRCRKVTLVDISPRILGLAAINIQNTGLTERIDLIESDIAHLEQFRDAEFSFVVCLGGSLSYVLIRSTSGGSRIGSGRPKGLCYDRWL